MIKGLIAETKKVEKVSAIFLYINWRTNPFVGVFLILKNSIICYNELVYFLYLRRRKKRCSIMLRL